MQFYSYVTATPNAPGMEDEPIGSDGRTIDRDLRTRSEEHTSELQSH